MKGNLLEGGRNSVAQLFDTIAGIPSMTENFRYQGLKNVVKIHNAKFISRHNILTGRIDGKGNFTDCFSVKCIANNFVYTSAFTVDTNINSQFVNIYGVGKRSSPKPTTCFLDRN